MSDIDSLTPRMSRAARRKEKNSDAQLTGHRSAGFARMEIGHSRKALNNEERTLRPERDTIRLDGHFNQSFLHNPDSQLSEWGENALKWGGG